MFKIQLKFQKILSLVLLLFSVVCFVFSIGLLTDMYGLYLSSAVSFFDGLSLYNEIQGFNHYAVIFAIVLICSSLLPFIFATNKRRLYYLDNFITIGLQAIIFVFYGIYMIINSIEYKNRFLNEVDFAAYKETADLFKFKYSESTFFFDINIVLAVLCFVFALIMIGNAVWKIMLMRKEKEILSLGEAND